MAKFNCALICQPNAIGKVLRVFPKLALLFFVVHVGLMIYALINSTAPVKKSIQKEETSLEHIKDDRIMSHGINDSIVNVKLNSSDHAKNRTILKGRVAQKLFNRGYQDVR